MTENNSRTSVFVIGIVILLACLCLLLVGLGGYLYYTSGQSSPGIDFPTFPSNNGTATPAPELTRPPLDSISSETLETLKTTIVPSNDLRDLACRLNDICDVPEVVATLASPRAIRDKEKI